MAGIIKKITALAVAAVTAGALGLGAAAEVVETAPETALPEVYCPVNDDPEFPFNIELDIAENSVSYIDLDEPVYGIERVLDEKALDFGMRVSLKDEFKDFENYTLELFTADYSDKLFSQSVGTDESIFVPNMSTVTGYKINTSLNSEALTAYYCWQFTVRAELDSTVVVDLFYQFAGTEGDMATYEDYLDENDSQNYALNQYDTLPLETVMKATINNNDSDYFAIKTSSDPSGNNTGVANLSFIFKLTPAAKINLEFFSNDNYSIGTFQTTDKTSLFMLKFGNLKKIQHINSALTPTAPRPFRTKLLRRAVSARHGSVSTRLKTAVRLIGTLKSLIP